MDPCIHLQKSVKDNATDLQNFMLDLKNWEDGAKRKERNVIYGINKDENQKEKTAVTRSDVEYVKAAFEDGRRQMKNSKWDLAEESFTKAIRKYKKNPAFFIKRAKCCIKLKKPDQAEEDCTSALAIDPKILKAKFIRSQAREMKGHLQGACLDLQDILILDPSNQTAKNALNRLKRLYDESLWKEGYQYVEEEDNGKVGNEDLPDVDALKEETIQLANAEKEKGNQFVKLENWEEAKESYSNAIKFNPNDPIFYANRALCFLKTKEEHRAILDCCMALKKNPRYVKVYMRRAAAKRAIGDLWGSRYDVKQVLTLEPNNSQAKIDLEELNLLIEKSSNEKKEVPFPSEAKIAQSGINNGISEVVIKKSPEFIHLLPVNKPIHLRSKKPFKRVPIKYIDEMHTEKVKRPFSKLYTSNDVIFDLTDTKDLNNFDIKSLQKAEKIEEASFSILDHQKNFKTEEKKLSLSKQVNQQSVCEQVNILNVVNKSNPHSSLLEFKYVLPTEKKPHLRSKKPLLRIPIRFI